MLMSLSGKKKNAVLQAMFEESIYDVFLVRYVFQLINFQL